MMDKKQRMLRLPLAALLWLLAGSMLLILSGTSSRLLGPRPALLPAASAADRATQDPQQVFDEGQALFEEQRYRAALEAFTALRADSPQWHPREAESWRLASALRWERETPGEQDRALLVQEARLFALRTGDTDEPALRVIIELTRLQGYGSDAQLFERAAQYLERRAIDDGEAVDDYLDLLEAALLARDHYYVGPDATLIRMWQNLVRAEASAEALVPLGERLLMSHGIQPYGHHPQALHQALPPHIAWKRQIALDLLEMQPDAALAAQCHLVLAHEAEYRGAFEEALREARTAQSLGEGKSDAARMAAELIERVAAPQITIGGDALYRPGSHHRLHVGWRNLRGWSLELRALDAVADLRGMKAALKDPSTQLAEFYAADGGERLWLESHPDGRELLARTEGSGAHSPRDSSLVLDPLSTGLYLAVVRGEVFDGQGADDPPPVAKHLIQVTELGLMVLPLDEGELEFWLHRADTGQPVGGLDLTVWHWETERGHPTRMTEMRVPMDGDGRVQVRAGVARGRQIFVSAQSRRGPVIFLGSVYGGSRWHESHPDWRGFVLSDRPLYRPNELVNLQVFARRAIAATRELELPIDLEVELIVTAPDGNEFARETHHFDENGSCETQLILPARPALGQYSVRVMNGKQTVVHGSFQVDEYRLPEFRVDLALDQEQRYVLGDTLRVDVDAEYLFGGAVDGVAELVVRRQLYYWYWWPPMPYGWKRSVAQDPWYGYQPQEEVLRTQLWLDGEGHASLSIPTHATPGQEQLRYEYIVEARVTDASRREETTTVKVRVGPQELYAALAPTRHVVLPNDEAQVRLHVEDLMQRPGVVDGRWELSVLAEDGKQRSLLEASVTTDENGDAELVFTPRKPGHYRVRYRALDSRGMELSADAVVWCADPKDRTLIHGGTGLQLIAAEDAFTGDSARVLLVSERPNQWVHLTHSFADTVRTDVFRLRGTSRILEIPLDHAQRPYFHLRVIGAWEYRSHQAQLQVETPNPERALSLELEFAEDEYRPGEMARLLLRAKDASGAPVRVPFTLAVTDAAVLQLMPRAVPELQPLFQRFFVHPLPGILLSAQRFGSYLDYDPDDESGPESEVEDWLGQGLLEEDLGRSRHRDSASLMPAAEGGARREVAKMASAQVMDAPAPSAAGVPATPVKIRADFRTTAMWRTAVWTDENGEGEVEFRLPESLTTWNAFGLALDAESRAGTTETVVRTRLPLMVRLAHPRVFREGDVFRFTGTVHNESEVETPALVRLAAEGLQIDSVTDSVMVPAHGQASVEWTARVPEGAAGSAVRRDEETGRIVVEPRAVQVTIEAHGRVESDAFVRDVEIHPWGTPLRLVTSGELRGGTTSLRLDLPGQRRDDLSVATLNLSPSVLSACLDALPYLAEFPYGCTEQTLSRFVPAVAVRAVAHGMGVSSRRLDPELDAKIAQGMTRIARMQHGDGGWGWWPEDESRAYMTAYALTALSEARAYGQSVDARMLQRGRDALRAMLPSLESRRDDLAYALYALASVDHALRGELAEDETMQRLATKLLRDRDEIGDYARARLASYLYMAARLDDGRLVLAKLQDGVQEDPKYGTAHWGRRRGYARRAEGAVETTAFALRAYLQLDPQHPHVRAAARWLVANRDGMRWDSTRSSAHAIYALCEFAKQQGELDPDYTLIARVGGKEMLRLKVQRQNLLDAGGSWPVKIADLVAADAELELELQGTGSIYASLSFDTWTADEDPSPTEHWLSVDREYLRLVPVRTLGGQVLLREELLASGDQVTSGDRIRVRLKLRAHRDLEYLEIHDPRPAGCEPVERLSGWTYAGSISGRREVRDEESAYFVSVIREGEHELVYELRAETPGVFRAPPALAGGMYLPDVNGSSRAFALGIE